MNLETAGFNLATTENLQPKFLSLSEQNSTMLITRIWENKKYKKNISSAVRTQSLPTSPGAGEADLHVRNFFLKVHGQRWILLKLHAKENFSR